MACSKEKEVLLNVIELYHDMPYLWQKNHKDYSNKDLRSQGLQVLLEVYKHFEEKATLTTFKKKLLNMRSNYNKELSKITSSKTTGAGAEEVYVPKLWYFEALNFLGSTSEPCRNTSDTLESENSHLGLSSDEESDKQREHVATTTTHRQPFKRKRETLLQKQENLLESAKALLQTKDNDWEVFGKSVGLQMKDLNKRQLTIAQKMISDVIFFAKLDRLSEDSHVVTGNQNIYPPNMNRHNYQFSSVHDTVSPPSNYCNQSPHYSSPSPHCYKSPTNDFQFKCSSTPTHDLSSSTQSNSPSTEIFSSLSSQNHSSPLQNLPPSYGSHNYQIQLPRKLKYNKVEPQHQSSPSTQQPSHSSVELPQIAIKLPCASKSQTITLYKDSKDLVKYVDNDLGPGDNFSPIITEGPANILKAFMIKRKKTNDPQ